MADVQAEGLQKGLAATYGRLQSLYLLVVSICGYLLLAALDHSSVALLNKDLQRQHDELLKASEARLAAQERVDRSYAQLDLACRAWQTAPEISLSCDRRCARGPSVVCGQEKVEQIFARDEALERSQQLERTARRATELEEQHLRAIRELAQARESWERESAPGAQAILKQRFQQLRAHVAGLARVAAEAALARDAARLRLAVVQGSDTAAADFLDAHAALDRDREALESAAAAETALSASHELARTQRREILTRRMTLPLLDVELDRAAVNRFAPMLMLLLLAALCLYVAFVNGRLRTHGKREGSVSPQDELGQFPWPMLFDAERPLMRWIAFTALSVLPLVMLAVFLLPAGYADCCPVQPGAETGPRWQPEHWICLGVLGLCAIVLSLSFRDQTAALARSPVTSPPGSRRFRRRRGLGRT